MVRKALGKSVAHATEPTFAGLASQVGFLMAPQLSGQGVGLAALLAAESALPHVQVHMVAQGAGVGQVIATYHTGTPWDQLGMRRESQCAKALPHC